MTDTGREYHIFLWIYAITTLQHLIDTVAINIGNTQLMELCRPRCLIVAAPCVAMMPVRRCAVIPIILEFKYIVMMLLTILGTIQAFHHQRRMHAVGVCDTEMACHKGILMTTVIVHIVGTIVARIFVFTILNLRIVELGTIYFFACQTIYYRDIERRIALLLVLIVGDAIAIDIKDATLERI